MSTTTAQPVTAPVRREPREAHVTVRPLRAGEGVEIRRLFRTGLPLGRRLELQYADIVNYERQRLDWYLTFAREHGRVAEVGGRIVAFALPCLDGRALDRWTRRRTVRWVARAVYRFGVGRLGAQGRRFMELRLRDLRDARAARSHRPQACPVLLHVVAPVPGAVDALTAAIDEAVATTGSSAWSYDVELRGPAHVQGLRRGDHPVDRIVLDRTLSWLAGEPVLRATVTRRVGPRHVEVRSTEPPRPRRGPVAGSTRRR